jgi:EpsD family peptidyl-prolyl cis-trans isomerase
MLAVMNPSAWAARLVSAVVAALAMSACTPKDSAGADPNQVAVRVNGREISVPQLQHVMQQRGLSASPGAAQRVAQSVVDQELAAQAAAKQGLDRDPRVIQAMEAARREVLAKAYADVLAEQAPLASTAEVDQFYERHPALFQQRRLFVLREMSVAAEPAVLQSLQPRVDNAADPTAALDLVRDAGLRSTVRELTVSPEDVPLPLLERLGQLRDGQSLLVPQPGGARILTVLSSRPAPVSRDAARQAIHAFLANERKGKAVSGGLKILRDEAKIDYSPRFDPKASAPAADAPAS